MSSIILTSHHFNTNPKHASVLYEIVDYFYDYYFK